MVYSFKYVCTYDKESDDDDNKKQNKGQIKDKKTCKGTKKYVKYLCCLKSLSVSLSVSVFVFVSSHCASHHRQMRSDQYRRCT